MQVPPSRGWTRPERASRSRRALAWRPKREGRGRPERRHASGRTTKGATHEHTRSYRTSGTFQARGTLGRRPPERPRERVRHARLRMYNALATSSRVLRSSTSGPIVPPPSTCNRGGSAPSAVVARHVTGRPDFADRPAVGLRTTRPGGRFRSPQRGRPRSFAKGPAGAAGRRDARSRRQSPSQPRAPGWTKRTR